MRASRILWALLLMETLLALPVPGYATTLTGDVTIDGKAVRGALVTAFTSDKTVSETVFTDAAGRYRLETEFTGRLTLRVRAPLARDGFATIEVPSTNAKLAPRQFSLKRLTTPEEISDDLPASAYFGQIKFKTLKQRHQFQADCTPCHQIGDPLTRQPRSLAEWKALMPSMLAYADYQTYPSLVDEYAALMFRAYDGKPISARENTTVDQQALSARIIEWKLPESEFPHDSNVDPANGDFYTVDLFVDKIWITNPRTNKTTIVPLPALGDPIGGSFAGKKGVPTWVPHIRHGNHSLRLSPSDGMFYLTGSVGGEIGVFDPVKHTYRVYRIGGNVAWPHTLVFDSKGMVWFTAYLSNQIGRFDPKTGKSILVDLPTGMAKEDNPKDKRIPAPYGIDVNPVDDSVWYTKIWADKIGRVDPKTLKVQEWTSPIKTPRRAQFDSKGDYWIPGLGDGKIARLDTKTMTYKIYPIPLLAPDETESPYDLAVDRKTGDVWVTDNMSDRMFRFAPRSKTWTAYPMPTKDLYQRDIFFTRDGWVCAPSSPTPPSNGADGSTDSLVCLQPDGNRSGTPAGKYDHPF